MTQEKKTFRPLTPEEVCQIYLLLHKSGQVTFAISADARHKVESLVSNINGSNYGISNYPETPSRIVAYLYFLIKDHAFSDGNKRVATIVFLTLCEMHGYDVELPDFGLDELVVALEQFPVNDHQLFIAELGRRILVSR